uniref:mannan endo-1,4-beta-mannosidase n=1 Tax=Salix viminalis TaxID=40686 RepID=A0A6N2NAG8_SALVM
MKRRPEMKLMSNENNTGLLFSYNLSVDRSGEMKRILGKSAASTLLTRKNTITGIEYRNDPTIFAWELMNEPRCISDPSGDTLQDWIEEMSAFVKTIDKNHLLTVGLEAVNPELWASSLGSDFVRNSKVPAIDFASVHIYPDHWFPHLEFEDKLKYVSKWMLSHIEDGMDEFNDDFGFVPWERESTYRVLTDHHADWPESRELLNKIII